MPRSGSVNEKLIAATKNRHFRRRPANQPVGRVTTRPPTLFALSMRHYQTRNSFGRQLKRRSFAISAFNSASKVASVALLALTLATLAGCGRLAPGDLHTVDRLAIAPRTPRVFLLRGYLDWYSTGIDRLTAELRSANMDATAFREEQWGDLSEALSRHTTTHPLVLIGFSYGADDVLLVARRLRDKNVAVDLLITIDPVTPADVATNVARCVNFYEPNGFWDIFPWLRGVPVTVEPGAVAENINVRARPDLDEPGTSHGTIAANEKIHRAVLELVSGLK